VGSGVGVYAAVGLGVGAEVGVYAAVAFGVGGEVGVGVNVAGGAGVAVAVGLGAPAGVSVGGFVGAATGVLGTQAKMVARTRKAIPARQAFLIAPPFHARGAEGTEGGTRIDRFELASNPFANSGESLNRKAGASRPG